MGPPNKTKPELEHMHILVAVSQIAKINMVHNSKIKCGQNAISGRAAKRIVGAVAFGLSKKSTA